MKRKRNDNLRRLLILLTAILWVGIIFLANFVLRSGGHLKPRAADLSGLIEGYGVVSGENGKGLGGAKITLSENGVNNYLIADSQGKFVISNLPYGKYDLTVDALGYKPLNTRIIIDGSGRSYSFTLAN